MDHIRPTALSQLTTAWRSPSRAAMLLQLARYAAIGIVVTLGAALGYWLLATPVGLDPALSLTIVFIVFTGIGYLLHSVISFRGHGARDRQAVRSVRYLAVNIIGFAINQAFIWALVTRMGGPTWWPVVPMVLITPFVTFALHRRWVFA